MKNHSKILCDRIKRPGQRDKSLTLKRTHVMRASLRRFKNKIQQKSTSLLYKSLIEYEKFDKSNCENEYETGYKNVFNSAKGLKTQNAHKRIPFSDVNVLSLPLKACKVLHITSSELENVETKTENSKDNDNGHQYPAIEKVFDSCLRSDIRNSIRFRTATIRRPMPCLNSRRFY